MTETTDIDLAVVHGNYLAHGGGEVVAEAIAETFDALIYYGFGDPDVVPDSSVEHRCLFDDIPGVFHRLCDRPMVRDAAFLRYGQHLPQLAEHDVLVFSGNEFAWYPPPDANVATLRYVHSPPRGAFDQFQQSGGRLVGTAVQTAIRTLFEPTHSYAEQVVANSELVAKRCRRFMDRDPAVVYPPVDVGSFEAAPREERGDYYLTLSRLSENKRLGDIVRAFTMLDKHLVVAGDGPERDRLEEMAGPSIEFRGYVDEAEKRDLLAHARAFVFNARDEDFGLVPVEAMAAGAPVIGVDAGFTGHQIVERWNGYSYPDESRANMLRETVRMFERWGVEATPDEIRGFAMEHFDIGRFREQMRDAVASAVDAGRVDVAWAHRAAESTDVAVSDGGGR